MSAKTTVSRLIEIAARRKATLSEADWDTLAELDEFGRTLFDQLQREVEAEPAARHDPAFRVLVTQLTQLDADNASRAKELRDHAQEVLAALHKGSQIAGYAPLGTRTASEPSPRMFDSAA